MQSTGLWVVVLRIYVAAVLFQPYHDLEAGDNQSLNFEWRGESNPGTLAPQAKGLTTRPPPPLPAGVGRPSLHGGGGDLYDFWLGCAVGVPGERI